MKTLLLMRHAKSSWKHPELEDQARPLAKRGERDAHRMSELIERRELIPQRILSSSAVRAAETGRIFCQHSGSQIPLNLLDELYLAEAEVYLAQLKNLPDEIERVMVIGHNPGLESLLQILSGQLETLPTAVVAYISLPINHWKELSPSTEGELIELWRPKELPVEEEKKKDKKKAKGGKKEAPMKAEKAKVEKAKEEKPKKSDKKDKK
jgi:phosphohistidine phosphatase